MFKTENNNENVFLNDCFNTEKYIDILEELKSEPDEELRAFLALAATRFIKLNYYKIAQYYYQADEKTKDWFKKLNLVIVDDNDAIENGYIKLTKKILKDAEIDTSLF